MNIKKIPTRSRIFWLPLAASLGWLGICWGLYSQAARVDEDHRLEIEHTRLSTVARQLMDARNWNAAHGGVYVPESDYGRPNPWLPRNERTLRTEDGRTLVLMNPAYMSRQLAERNSEPGIAISIISREPLRPENLADPWEGDALAECASGAREIFSPPQDPGHGQGRSRLLSVLIAQQSCLRCHVDRAVGQVLGGISVSQDAEPYLRNAAKQRRNMLLLYSLLGLTGVTAIGGLTLTLTRRRWLAEETSRMKSAFMARLSHDMRTPLTAIVGMSEMLQQPETREEERKRALRYLTEAGGALLEMVRDITDHAVLEQGEPHLQPAPFRLRACLAQCLNIYRPLAESKGIGLELLVPEDTPDMLLGDSFRLRQALGNLVSNAVKFTSRGGVSVTVRAKRGNGKVNGAGKLCLFMDVRDSGPGLPPQDRERIFESFERGADTISCPGTGLGLHIARTLARLMGGDVRVESAPGRGSCFSLEVCLGVVAPGPEKRQKQNVCREKGAVPGRTGRTLAQGQSQQAVSGLEGLRILVAEDNAASACALQSMLTSRGARPFVAENGLAALEALARGPWDLLILDARMPAPEGLEVLERIRAGQTPAPPDQRVILYTAALGRADAETCGRLRADKVLVKPLSFAQLHAEILEVLEPARRGSGECSCAPLSWAAPPESRGRSAEKNAGKSVEDPLVWNREEALAAMDGDAALLERLRLVLARDLREKRGQLAGAPAAMDAQTLRRLAHATKNSAATLRLSRLRQACALAEKAEEEELPAAAAAVLAALEPALAALEGCRPAAAEAGTDAATETETEAGAAGGNLKNPPQAAHNVRGED